MTLIDTSEVLALYCLVKCAPSHRKLSNIVSLLMKPQTTAESFVNYKLVRFL